MKLFFAGLLLGWVLDHTAAWAAKEMTGWTVEMELYGSAKVSCVNPRMHETQRLLTCEGRVDDDDNREAK